MSVRKLWRDAAIAAVLATSICVASALINNPGRFQSGTLTAGRRATRGLAMGQSPDGGALATQNAPRAELMQAGPLGEEALGSNKAPVTIIEYVSLDCPHCAHFAENTLPKLKKEYIDTGKVRYVIREFPSDPTSVSAFMLARCARKGDYFSVVDLFFRTQREWAVQKPLLPLLSVARQAGFTENRFRACLADQKLLDGIEQVRNRAAKKFKVDATPTFFINGRKFVGDVSIEDRRQSDPALSRKLTALLQRFQPSPSSPASPLQRLMSERSAPPEIGGPPLSLTDLNPANKHSGTGAMTLLSIEQPRHAGGSEFSIRFSP
jgi:protein-disulfide isomerase